MCGRSRLELLGPQKGVQQVEQQACRHESEHEIGDVHETPLLKSRRDACVADGDEGEHDHDDDVDEISHDCVRRMPGSGRSRAL
jgi:hypothetical protein